MNIVTITDNGITYKAKWYNETYEDYATIGEYMTDTKAIKAAKEYIDMYVNGPYHFIYDEA